MAEEERERTTTMAEEAAEIIEADEEPMTRSVAVRPETALFGHGSPTDVIAKATEAAEALAKVVRDRGLAMSFGGDREHVNIEGWQLLGAMVGIYAEIEWTRQATDENGWWAEPKFHIETRKLPSKFKAGQTYEKKVRVVDVPGKGGWQARVVMRRASDGAVVGTAEAECRWSEPNWADSDSYALRSMAQTRATSKGYRIPLGFVMTLAGFAATPAEEMDGVPHTHKITGGDKSAYTCPSCGAAVYDNRGDPDRGRRPAWSCSNKTCAGGGPKKDGSGNWPWGSYEEDPEKAFGVAGGEYAEGHDIVDRLHYLVAKNVTGGNTDLAEALVIEAAVEQDLVWPDQSITTEQANEIFRRTFALNRRGEEERNAEAAFHGSDYA